LLIYRWILLKDRGRLLIFLYLLENKAKQTWNGGSIEPLLVPVLVLVLLFGGLVCLASRGSYRLGTSYLSIYLSEFEDGTRVNGVRALAGSLVLKGP